MDSSGSTEVPLTLPPIDPASTAQPTLLGTFNTPATTTTTKTTTTTTPVAPNIISATTPSALGSSYLPNAWVEQNVASGYEHTRCSQVLFLFPVGSELDL